MKATMRRSYELPKDLVLRIFAMNQPWEGDDGSSFDLPVLTPKDRARCQAVCRNWRAWLSPGALPLGIATMLARTPGPHAECCHWEDREGYLPWEELHRHHAAAHWLGSSRAAIRCLALDVCTEENQTGTESVEALHNALLHIQPGELKELHLLFWRTSSPLQLFWPVLPRFTALRALDICAGQDGSLSHTLLAGLPALECLGVWHADEVVLAGNGALLPRLTRLECTDTNRLELAAELPSLRKLKIWRVENAVLASAALRLPALTKLEAANCRLRVDLEKMPTLQHLLPPVMGFIELAGDPARFSTLTHLTSLELRWVPGIMARTYCQLLRHAPRALRSLTLGVDSINETDVPEALLAAAAEGAPQLTHLACFAGAGSNEGSAGLVLPHLAPFKQLEELQLEWEAVGSLTLSQLGLLAGLPKLKRLVVNERYATEWSFTPAGLMKKQQQLEMLRRALGERVQVQDEMAALYYLPPAQ